MVRIRSTYHFSAHLHDIRSLACASTLMKRPATSPQTTVLAGIV